MGRGAHGEVRDGSEDPRRGSGRVGGLTGWFGTALRTLWVVRDGSGDARGDPGWVGGTLGRSRTALQTLWVVRDGSGNARGVQDWSGDPPEGPGLVEYTMGGPGRIGGPTVGSGTGQGTLGKVWDHSREPRGGL